MSNSITTVRVVGEMSQLLCIAFLLLTCCALSAQNQEHRVRNIVPVHGAWADGPGWKGVYDILVKDGQRQHRPRAGDVVQRRCGCHEARPCSTKWTCILVAHSCGGAVITEAGTDPSVAGLVYVAAQCIQDALCATWNGRCPAIDKRTVQATVVTSGASRFIVSPVKVDHVCSPFFVLGYLIEFCSSLEHSLFTYGLLQAPRHYPGLILVEDNPRLGTRERRLQPNCRAKRRAPRCA